MFDVLKYGVWPPNTSLIPLIKSEFLTINYLIAKNTKKNKLYLLQKEINILNYMNKYSFCLILSDTVYFVAHIFLVTWKKYMDDISMHIFFTFDIFNYLLKKKLWKFNILKIFNNMNSTSYIILFIFCILVEIYG